MNKDIFNNIMFGKVQVLTNSIKNYFNSSFDLFNMFLEEKNTGTYTVYGG